VNGPTQVRCELVTRSGRFTGDPGLMAAILKRVGCPRQWDSRRRDWSVPLAHVADVIAALEHWAGVDVDLVDPAAGAA
jgi:hypothetical protein